MGRAVLNLAVMVILILMIWNPTKFLIPSEQSKLRQHHESRWTDRR